MKYEIAIRCIAAGALGIIFTGCASSPAPIAPKRAVIVGQARLDIASDSAEFPLDKYGMQGGVASSNAENLATKTCMAAAGHVWEIKPYTTSESNNWRLFGLWNAPLAAQYGYDVPPKPVRTTSPPAEAGGGEGEGIAFKKCLSLTEKLFPRSDSWAKYSAQNLSTESFLQTMEDPDSKSLIDMWEKCMLTHGLTIKVRDSGVLMADVDMKTMPLELQMQTAVNEVQCKTDNNIVQQLADIDASYQVVLIAKHQVELNKELALNKKTDAAVAKYLATHG